MVKWLDYTLLQPLDYLSRKAKIPTTFNPIFLEMSPVQSFLKIFLHVRFLLYSL